MVAFEVHSDPYDSCHHIDTTDGDTFGGLGTSREFREEELPRLRPENLDYRPIRIPTRSRR
jgi:hypothetical protein